MNEYDTGEKPLSDEEKEKRDTIREQKNKYLQIATMDPDVYNDDELFEELMGGILDDYNADLEDYHSLMYLDDEHDEYFKKTYKKQLEMIRKIYYLINEGNDDYLGIIRD